MATIHPTAIVDPKAELDAVGRGRALRGDRRRMCASAHGTLDRCALRDRWPHQHRRATTASSSSHRSAGRRRTRSTPAKPTRLEIGNDNTIREFCTINTGTVQDVGVTRLGDDNWIMAYVHVAHDCQLGSHTILANAVQLAGHVHLGDWVFLGGLSGVHQFVRVGAHAMTGFQTRAGAGRAAVRHGGGQPGAGAGHQPGRPAAPRLHARAHRPRQADAQAAVPPGADAGRGTRARSPSLPRKTRATTATCALMLDFLAAAERGIVR